jgi:Holliday junction resolvase RusA-like endonuclease
MTVTFHVPGIPQGKQRPRFSPKSGGVYTPTKTVTAENNVAWAFQQTGYPRVDTGPVFLDVVVVLDRPRSHFNTKGDLNKPDADNVQKLLMDSLNGVAYRDDAQVVYATVYRRWAQRDETAGLTVTLSTVAPDTLANVEGMAA